MSEATGTVTVLMQRLVEGKSDAIGLLLAKYRPYLRLVAQQAIRDLYQRRFDASDIVQQTCVEALDGFATFRGSSEREFHGWIVTILKRNVATFVRKHTAKKRDARRDMSLLNTGEMSLEWHPAKPSDEGPASILLRGEAALLLAETISQLPRDEREAVQMRFVEGLKVAEIAAHLEVSTSKVSGMLARGIASLRRRLPSSTGMWMP